MLEIVSQNTIVCNPLSLTSSLLIISENNLLSFKHPLFSQLCVMWNSIFSVTLHELSLMPEFFLAFTSVTIITHCSLLGYSKQYKNILLQFSLTSLCMLILFLTLVLYCNEKSILMKHLSFEFAFLNDSLGFFSKIVTIFISLVCMYFIQDYILDYRINSTEYDLLMLYSILGLTMLVAANDFGTIFLALELQSLSLYMLSGFKKNSIYSIESGLKYFILGALSAAYFLLGWSLLYGISGLFVLLSFHFFFFNAFFSKDSQFKKSAIECLTFDENKSSSDTDLSESFLIELKHLPFFIGDADDAIAISVGNPNFKTVKVKVGRFICPDDNVDDTQEEARKLIEQACQLLHNELLESEDKKKTPVNGEKREIKSYNNRDLCVKAMKKLEKDEDRFHNCEVCEEVRKMLEEEIKSYNNRDLCLKAMRMLEKAILFFHNCELCIKAMKKLEKAEDKPHNCDVCEEVRKMLVEAWIHIHDVCEEAIKILEKAMLHNLDMTKKTAKMFKEAGKNRVLWEEAIKMLKESDLYTRDLCEEAIKMLEKAMLHCRDLCEKAIKMLEESEDKKKTPVIEGEKGKNESDDNCDLCEKARKMLEESDEDKKKTPVIEGEKGENESDDNGDRYEDLIKMIMEALLFFDNCDICEEAIKMLEKAEAMLHNCDLCEEVRKMLVEAMLHNREICIKAKKMLEEAWLLNNRDLCEEAIKMLEKVMLHNREICVKAKKMLKESEDKKKTPDIEGEKGENESDDNCDLCEEARKMLKESEDKKKTPDIEGEKGKNESDDNGDLCEEAIKMQLKSLWFFNNCDLCVKARKMLGEACWLHNCDLCKEVRKMLKEAWIHNRETGVKARKMLGEACWLCNNRDLCEEVIKMLEKAMLHCRDLCEKAIKMLEESEDKKKTPVIEEEKGENESDVKGDRYEKARKMIEKSDEDKKKTPVIEGKKRENESDVNCDQCEKARKMLEESEDKMKTPVIEGEKGENESDDNGDRYEDLIKMIMEALLFFDNCDICEEAIKMLEKAEAMLHNCDLCEEVRKMLVEAMLHNREICIKAKKMLEEAWLLNNRDLCEEAIKMLEKVMLHNREICVKAKKMLKESEDKKKTPDIEGEKGENESDDNCDLCEEARKMLKESEDKKKTPDIEGEKGENESDDNCDLCEEARKMLKESEDKKKTPDIEGEKGKNESDDNGDLCEEAIKMQLKSLWFFNNCDLCVKARKMLGEACWLHNCDLCKEVRKMLKEAWIHNRETGVKARKMLGEACWLCNNRDLCEEVIKMLEKAMLHCRDLCEKAIKMLEESEDKKKTPVIEEEKGENESDVKGDRYEKARKMIEKSDEDKKKTPVIEGKKRENESDVNCDQCEKARKMLEESEDKMKTPVTENNPTKHYIKKKVYKTDELELASSSLILVLVSFFFKLAVAPFHLWSLDIYEGSLTSSTVFFAVVTKFSVVVILIKICYLGFYSLLKSSLYQSIITVSVLSILVGSAAGLAERKLKSLLAYSSINNIGYVLLALAVGTLNGVKTALFYLIIYLSSSLATWSGLISIQLKNNRYTKKQNKEFDDVVMLKKSNPTLTMTLQIALFSTAGLPPFMGFLTKMNVFLASVESHVFLVSIITIVLSIVSTFYYLRLVKIMCFEKMLVGKLYKPMKLKQSTVNSIFSSFLLYQFFKPWFSVFFSYKVIIC